MKRFSTFIVFLLIVFMAQAQAPKGINYQGVARDNEGNPLANKTIAIRIGILKNAADGEVEYSETHKPQTNQFGLFTLVIGQGTKITGDFAFVSWAIGTKWLKVEIDPTGGSSFTLSGSQQLMTVPYAFYAETAGNGSSLTAGQGISITGDVISNTGDADNSVTNELQNLSEVLTRSNNAGGVKITNLGAPTAGTDAATKNYVDTQISNDLDKDPTNELQNLGQVLSQGANANNAGGQKITNLGAPTVNSDATTKQYVDNAIATTFAFKVPYSFTNPGGSLVNQVVNFGADIYDDFNVTTANRFVAPANGIYMFFVDGTVNNNNAILSIRVNSTTVYKVKNSEERIGLNVFINHSLSLMLKLAQNDFVELVITTNTPGDNVVGNLFGFKL